MFAKIFLKMLSGMQDFGKENLLSITIIFRESLLSERWGI